MNRFEILERKPREKVTSYWSRFKGFYQDNRIKKDDKLTVDNKKPTEDEKQCRFSKSTELVSYSVYISEYSWKNSPGVISTTQVENS